MILRKKGKVIDMKSIKTSKIVMIMLALVLMVPMIKPASVKAANTTDKNFSFNLYSTSSVYAITAFESKDNNSSVYLYSGTMSGTLNSVYVKIYGSKIKTGSEYNDRTYMGRNYYYTGTRISREVFNTVNESGDSYAAVAARGRTGIGVATGKWSPDTAGSYAEMSY